MKNYTEIRGDGSREEIIKLRKELQKKDNIIQFLITIIDIIKHDVNIKEHQLDYLINHMKNNNFSDFSYKICINSLDKLTHNNIPASKHHLNTPTITHSNPHSLSYFQRLSTNIITEIFSFLSLTDLIFVGMSCKKLHKISCDNLFWEEIYLREFNNFLLFDDKDKCKLITNPEEYIEKSNIKKENHNFFKQEYEFMKKLKRSWEKERPIVTTISTNSCITCLNLDTETNELIYSDVDGSAGIFRLYPYRKLTSEELCMQHHKQKKICDKLSSFYGHCGPIWCLDRNDDTLFTGSYDKTIKLWDIKTGHCKNTIRAHSSWVSAIQYDRNFDKLISSSWDATIKIWDKNLQNELVMNVGENNYVYCISANLSQGKIYSGTEMKTIDIWDVNQPNEKIFSFYGHVERINNLKNYGNLIFSGSEDKQGRIWDTRTKNCQILLTGHSRGITQIDYDEVSNRVFTASIDKTIKIWDIRKNTELRTLVGHSGGVYSIAFDHGKLISGSKDNSIRIWNFLN